MAVKKISGFDAPYRSKSFRDMLAPLVGRTGLLSIDAPVSDDGTTITVPPLTFVQDGLIVRVDAATTKPLPGLPDAYHLIVTSPTMTQVDDLVWSFATVPSELPATAIVVATFDGLEWRNAPVLSVGAALAEAASDNVVAGLTGPKAGLLTSPVAGTYETVGGALIDSHGERVLLALTALYSPPVLDPDATLRRVDRVVYRRATDAPARIGQRRLLTGGTFAATGIASTMPVGLGATSGPKGKSRTFFAADQTAYVVFVEGYGASFTLKWAHLSADRSALIATWTIATATSAQFSAAHDDAHDTVHLAYEVDGTIHWAALDLATEAVSGPSVLDDGGLACLNPTIAVSAVNGRAYIVYQRTVGASSYELRFRSLTLSGTTMSGPSAVTSGAPYYQNADLAVAFDQSLHLVYEEVGTGRIFYQQLDEVGAAVGAVRQVSLDVDVTAAGDVGTHSDGMTAPRVLVTDGAQVLVTYLYQFSGTFYVALWDGAGAAVLPPLPLGATEYDVTLEPCFDGILVSVSDGTGLAWGLYEGRQLKWSESQAGTWHRPTVARDPAGSLLLTHATLEAGNYVAYRVGATVAAIGPGDVTGSQGTVSLAADEVLISAAGFSRDPAPGDQIAISGASTPGNNLTGLVTASAKVSLSAADDSYKVTLDQAFAGAENPAVGVTATASAPAGEALAGFKSSSTTAALAFRTSAPARDILLARIVLPAGEVLNYIGPDSDIQRRRYLVVAQNVQATWGGGALELAAAPSGSPQLKVYDFLENTYEDLQLGTYALADDQALYVDLDVTPLVPAVANLAEVPHGNRIVVLGTVFAGQFNSVGLSPGMAGTLDEGEQVVFGEDVPEPLRSKLGFLSETEIRPYPTTIGFSQTDDYPTAIGQLSLMSGQNRHVRLVRGVVSWSSGGALVFGTDSFVQVPGVPEARNRVAAQTVTLAADGDVAYVSLNRTGTAAATLPVLTAAMSALSPGRDTFVVARRVGANLVFEATGLTLVPGTTVDVGLVSGKSVQIDASGFGGALSAADTDPQKALATLDVYFKALQLQPHPTLPKRLVLTGVDQLKTDGSTIGQMVKKNLMKFDGAQLDMESGTAYAADGTTVLPASSFVPTALAASLYRWYAVALSVDTLGTDNRYTVNLTVTQGAADDADKDAAARADLKGDVPVGQVWVQEKADGTGLEDLGEANIVHLGSGAGSGSGSGAGDPSFLPAGLSGSTLTLQGGEIQLESGPMLVSGSGTTSATTGYGNDIAIDLATILAAPADNTAYYLCIDLYRLDDEITLTDTQRKVKAVSQALHFALLDQDPATIPGYRYVPVAWITTPASGNTWTGAQLGQTPPRTHAQLTYSPPAPFKQTITSAGDFSFNHGFDQEPDIVFATFYDGTDNAGVDAARAIKNVDATVLEISAGSFDFGNPGSKLTVKAFVLDPVKADVAAPGTTWKSGWIQTVETEVTHPLQDAENVADYSVIKWDMTTGRRKKVSDTVVTEWDDQKFYLDFRGETPDANNRYRIVAGGSAALFALPLEIGGFTKFVGYGPGAYKSLSAALAAAQPGDRILINRDLVETDTVTVATDDVVIMQMPGTKITVQASVTRALYVTGNRVELYGVNVCYQAGSSFGSVVSVAGSNCRLLGCRAQFDAAAETLLNFFRVDAGADGSFIVGSTELIAGSSDFVALDFGTNSTIVVPGATSLRRTVQAYSDNASPFQCPTGISGSVVLVTCSGGTVILPPASPGLEVTIKDAAGTFAANPLSLQRSGGAGAIDGVALDQSLSGAWGSYTFLSDGTDWFKMGA